MAYISYEKLGWSEYDKNISAEDRVQDIKF